MYSLSTLNLFFDSKKFLAIVEDLKAMKTEYKDLKAAEFFISKY